MKRQNKRISQRNKSKPTTTETQQVTQGIESDHDLSRQIPSHCAFVAVGIVTVNDMLFYGLIKLRDIWRNHRLKIAGTWLDRDLYLFG